MIISEITKNSKSISKIVNNVISIENYSVDKLALWNQFVDESKNGTFMLNRGFIEYHSDRFVDYSLMIYDNNKLAALLPASKHGNELRSHGGLTYGGFVIGRKMTAQLMLCVMESVKSFLKAKGFKTLTYKRIPYIYYDYPSDEDLYALFRVGAQLTRRDISTSIFLRDRIRFNERRRRNVKKAIKANLTFRQSDDFCQYIDILAEVLSSRHNTKPVHTADEIKLLAERFPENIKLYASYDGDKMLAGSIIFETPRVAHSQYIASSPAGRNCGALDFCFDKLINDIYSNKEYFDFGISTEDRGLFLNEGLVEQKQEFGGRGVIYEEYTLKI